MSEFCKDHSGVVQEVRDMKYFAKLAMIVFILIGMAVIGFLWHGQERVASKVDSLSTSIIGDGTDEHPGVRGRIMSMEKKLDDHILATKNGEAVHR